MSQWGLGNAELLAQQRITKVVHSEGNLLIITTISLLLIDYLASVLWLMQFPPTRTSLSLGNAPSSRKPSLTMPI